MSVNLKFIKKIIITNMILMSQASYSSLPDGFSLLNEKCPTIKIEASYATVSNFTGQVVDGYLSKKVFLTNQMVNTLCEIQKKIEPQGLSLKIFDGYRPVRAVDFFKNWAANSSDDLELKKLFYPFYTKQELFEKGYIASKSGHSRGSAVDLTLIDLKTNQELDMGTRFDYFHESSNTHSKLIKTHQYENRLFLLKLMEDYGLKNYSKEWWHFSLVNEPYPDTYFDFIIN